MHVQIKMSIKCKTLILINNIETVIKMSYINYTPAGVRDHKGFVALRCRTSQFGEVNVGSIRRSQ